MSCCHLCNCTSAKPCPKSLLMVKEEIIAHNWHASMEGRQLPDSYQVQDQLKRMITAVEEASAEQYSSLIPPLLQGLIEALDSAQKIKASDLELIESGCTKLFEVLFEGFACRKNDYDWWKLLVEVQSLFAAFACPKQLPVLFGASQLRPLLASLEDLSLCAADHPQRQRVSDALFLALVTLANAAGASQRVADLLQSLGIGDALRRIGSLDQLERRHMCAASTLVLCYLKSITVVDPVADAAMFGLVCDYLDLNIPSYESCPESFLNFHQIQMFFEQPFLQHLPLIYSTCKGYPQLEQQFLKVTADSFANLKNKLESHALHKVDAIINYYTHFLAIFAQDSLSNLQFKNLLEHANWNSICAWLVEKLILDPLNPILASMTNNILTVWIRIIQIEQQPKASDLPIEAINLGLHTALIPVAMLQADSQIMINHFHQHASWSDATDLFQRVLNPFNKIFAQKLGSEEVIGERFKKVIVQAGDILADKTQDMQVVFELVVPPQ